MKQIITLTQETIDLFSSQGTIVHTKGENYFYFPFWLKETENKFEFERMLLDDLPDDFIKDLNHLRQNGSYGSFDNKEEIEKTFVDTPKGKMWFDDDAWRNEKQWMEDKLNGKK